MADQMNVEESFVDFFVPKVNLTQANYWEQQAQHPYLRDPQHAHGGFVFFDVMSPPKIEFSNYKIMVFGSKSYRNPNKKRRCD